MVEGLQTYVAFDCLSHAVDMNSAIGLPAGRSMFEIKRGTVTCADSCATRQCCRGLVLFAVLAALHLLLFVAPLYLAWRIHQHKGAHSVWRSLPASCWMTNAPASLPVLIVSSQYTDREWHWLESPGWVFLCVLLQTKL